MHGRGKVWPALAAEAEKQGAAFGVEKAAGAVVATASAAGHKAADFAREAGTAAAHTAAAALAAAEGKSGEVASAARDKTAEQAAAVVESVRHSGARVVLDADKIVAGTQQRTK